MENLNVNKFTENLKNKYLLTSKDIFNYYKKSEPDIKPSTVNWRISNLVKNNKINRLGYGKFIIGKVNIYIPDVNSRMVSFYKLLKRKFPYANICIWDTAFLNEFMIHQAGKSYLIIEADKESTESIFYYLREKNYRPYLKPNEDIMNRYVSDEKNSIIIKPLVSEAPTKYVKKIRTITIEKMLVDVFCDKIIFSSQQGSELSNIFNMAFEKYDIDKNKMLRYAARRRKKDKLIIFFNKILIQK